MKKLISLVLCLGLCLGATAALSSCSLLIPDTTVESTSTSSDSSDVILPDVVPSTETEADLIAALQAGGEVTLGANIELSSVIEIPMGVISALDLNGFTLTAALKEEGRHHYAFDNYGVFTIKGEGTISARGVENFGAMFIEDGVTINALDGNGGAAVWNEGDLVINGGTFNVDHVGSVNDAYGPGCLNNSADGKIIINGGTFNSASMRTYAIISSGELLINDATVHSAHGALAVSKGNVTIAGGEFNATQHYGLYVSGGTVETNGGTFNGERYEIDVCAEGGDVTLNKGTSLVHNGIWGSLLDKRSSIVREYVGTADDLAAALAEGKNVVLSKNVTLNEDIHIPFGKSATLDLGGNNISVALESEGRHYYAIRNEGALTLKGEGKISARGIQNYGLMSIDGNVIIEAIDTNGGAAIWNDGGDLTINGGTFKALHAGSPSDSAGPGCLANKNGGTVTINGGTFISNSQRTYAIINDSNTCKLTINDAIVNSAHGAIAVNGGEVKIEGGTFTATLHYGLYTSGGNITVNGGAFEGAERYQTDIYVDSGNVVLNNCTLKYNGIKGTVTDNRQ